jgi:curli biogenesis system outer membrane secretion channel CsgG
MQVSRCATAVSLLLLLAMSLNVPALGAQRSKGLERCDKPIATLAVVEPENLVVAALMRFNLPSPTSLIRMVIQQSGCFLVVERGAAMSNLLQERALAKSGELQQQSNVGGGQLRAADFILTPNVIFSEGNAGGILGGIASGLGGVWGSVTAAGLKFKEAQTSMLVSDMRSGLQVAAAEGKARKSNFGLGAIAGSAGLGAYTNTNEGKVIAASFVNNYNRIVLLMRDDPEMVRLAANSATNAPTNTIRANAVYAEGDVLLPKIDNIKIYESPVLTARTLGLAGKSSELVFLGEERDGFVRIESASAQGWVRKTLVAKR